MNYKDVDKVTRLFNQLAVISSELEALEDIVLRSQDPEVVNIMNIEQHKKIDPDPIKFMDPDQQLPIIILQTLPVGAPTLHPQISQQVKERQKFETYRYDYQLSEAVTARIMDQVANELKRERDGIIADLGKFNIIIK